MKSLLPDLFKTIDQYQNRKCVAQSWKQARKDTSFNTFGIAGGDELETYKLGLLRFSNQFPAIAYAMGIEWQTLQLAWPAIYSIQHHYDTVKGHDWPSLNDLIEKKLSGIDSRIIEEIFDRDRWNWHEVEKMALDYYQGCHNQYFSLYKIHDQINFLKTNQTRVPKCVLEVGGGRGELANTFQFMNIPCVSLEPGTHANLLYDLTAKIFFGESVKSASPDKRSLKEFSENSDLSKFDTIIFCESIEHVQESEFWNFWHNVRQNFNGTFIIVNYILYHPIEAFDGTEHIFEINDNLYDILSSDSKNVRYRNGSNLVLEF